MRVVYWQYESDYSQLHCVMDAGECFDDDVLFFLKNVLQAAGMVFYIIGTYLYRRLKSDKITFTDSNLERRKENDMRQKVFSRIEQLPKGNASEKLVDGCLVLEGGAFRGVYGEGVLDAFMENDINFSNVIGVSAGALNGMNYVSGQIGRSARVNLSYRHDKNYIGLPAWKKSHSILSVDFLLNDIKETDPFNEERFFRPEQRYWAVATNCKTGKAEYFEKGKCDIMSAIKASASMPYISPMVEVDGIPCLDGGCACKIPYRWALENGFEKIVVVRTRDASFRKGTGERSAKLARRVYRNYPEFAEALAQSNQSYNAQCDEIEALGREGRIFVVGPSKPVTVSRLEEDMEKLGELYYLGYSDAMSQMERLKQYIYS